jgi:hypothetical protein
MSDATRGPVTISPSQYARKTPTTVTYKAENGRGEVKMEWFKLLLPHADELPEEAKSTERFKEATRQARAFADPKPAFQIAGDYLRELWDGVQRKADELVRVWSGGAHTSLAAFDVLSYSRNRPAGARPSRYG